MFILCAAKILMLGGCTWTGISQGEQFVTWRGWVVAGFSAANGQAPPTDINSAARYMLLYRCLYCSERAPTIYQWLSITWWFTLSFVLHIVTDRERSAPPFTQLFLIFRGHMQATGFIVDTYVAGIFNKPSWSSIVFLTCVMWLCLMQLNLVEPRAYLRRDQVSGRRTGVSFWVNGCERLTNHSMFVSNRSYS